MERKKKYIRNLKETTTTAEVDMRKTLF